jgi:hypothetical protein
MATAQVTVMRSQYVSLGNGPMLISAHDAIMIAGGSQPVAGFQGHAISHLDAPFYFPLTEQVWAILISPSSGTDLAPAAASTVTITT